MSAALLKPCVINPSAVTERLDYYRQQNKKFYDRTAKPLSQLKEGDVIRFPDRSGKFMRKGTIISESREPRSYILESGGQAYRRNRRHLLKVKEEREPVDIEGGGPNYGPIPREIAEEEHEEPNHEPEPEPADEPTATPEPKRSRYGRLIKPPDRLNL